MPLSPSLSRGFREGVHQQAGKVQGKRIVRLSFYNPKSVKALIDELSLLKTEMEEVHAEYWTRLYADLTLGE